ncbi:MAG: archaellin/type IV pilin N-terminal domain-containing protein [Candidatus Bathyarchaeia archaeon]
MKKMLRSRKALSPVIATVILVSVTIVVAVSVAYWMGSIAGTYTRFEKVEIPTAYANKIASFENNPSTVPQSPVNFTGNNGWNITIVLKNSGSADATIDNVFINGKPYSQFSYVAIRYGGSLVSGTLSITVNAGGSATLEVLILQGTDQGITFSSGTALDIKLHSAAGKEYPKLMDLT